jgi:hypothetical protein
MNAIEYVFNDQVSMVHKAYWTRDLSSLNNRKSDMEIKLDLMLHLRDIELDEECSSIDITQEVQS